MQTIINSKPATQQRYTYLVAVTEADGLVSEYKHNSYNEAMKHYNLENYAVLFQVTEGKQKLLLFK